jgi:hypothetical protein
VAFGDIRRSNHGEKPGAVVDHEAHGFLPLWTYVPTALFETPLL